MFLMTISKNAPQVIVNKKSKLKLPSKAINAVKVFVKNNAELLDKLADEKIDFDAFLQQMKK